MSIEKNEAIYAKIRSELTRSLLRPQVTLSVYRVSLFLFVENQIRLEDALETKITLRRLFGAVSLDYKSPEGGDYKILSEKWRRKQFLDKMSEWNVALGIFPFVRNIIESSRKKIFGYIREDDFCLSDVESYEETYELLSELEATRIDVFKDFLDELKPIFRKGIVESLKCSSEVRVNDIELSTIYSLLGYYSTQTGRDFLCDPDDPELIQRARKLGDFTGLKKESLRQKYVNY